MRLLWQNESEPGGGEIRWFCGEWGCGKTSLKNMVIERLRHGRRAGVDILEFNPWQFSGHDTLSASFFAELLHAVERDQPDNSASKQRAKKLRLYARLAVLGAGAMKFVGRATRSFGDDMAAPSALLETAAGAVENVGDSVTQAAEARKQLYLISL